MVIDILDYGRSTITTIGYGYIYPVTKTGRILSIVYCIFGIPLTIITIKDIAYLLAKLLNYPSILLGNTTVIPNDSEYYFIYSLYLASISLLHIKTSRRTSTMLQMGQRTTTNTCRFPTCNYDSYAQYSSNNCNTCTHRLDHYWLCSIIINH